MTHPNKENTSLNSLDLLMMEPLVSMTSHKQV